MCVELACLENNITDIFFDLIREFGESIRNLIIGNYNSVPRSLRWIIESAIFWANMQDDNRNSTEAFYHYCNYLPISKTRFQYLRSQVKEVNYQILVERLFLIDEWRKSFRDILPKISVIKADSKFFKNVRNFSFEKKIGSLYHQFSSYEHITLQTLSEINHNLRSDFASYMNYRYDEESFLSLLRNIWDTLDLILSVLVLTFTRFYGYNNGKLFINRLKNFAGRSNIRYFVNLCNSNRVKPKLPIFLNIVMG